MLSSILEMFKCWFYFVLNCCLILFFEWLSVVCMKMYVDNYVVYCIVEFYIGEGKDNEIN